MRFGRLLCDLDFDTLIIDEAAQVQEAWVWGLLQKSIKRLYMAGDPHQLPALVSQEGEKYNYGKSLMQRLYDLNASRNCKIL